MSKRIVLSIFCFLLLVPLSVQADAPSQSEEALLSVLFPSINEAIEKQYGTTKKYDCAEIISLQKKYPKAYIFTCKVRIVIYQKDYQPPFEELTFTYSNESGVWEIIDVQKKILPNNFSFSQCQK